MFRSLHVAFAGLLAVAVSASVPATARDWPETAGWEISASDDFCLMHMEYEGPGDSSLAIGLYADGGIIIANVNYSWSAEKGRPYPEVSFELNGQSYSGTAVGVDILGKKGFAMKFGSDILADIAAAPAVHIYKGGSLVDRLQLKGSAAALGVTKRCLASIRAKHAADERERRRWADLPKDPFAADVPKVVASAARGNTAMWVSQDDYLPSAIRNGEEGTAKIAWTINVQGRVENCHVVESSGSQALDEASCAAITRRRRYSPATDDKGDPVPSAGERMVKWSLPSG